MDYLMICQRNVFYRITDTQICRSWFGQAWFGWYNWYSTKNKFYETDIVLKRAAEVHQ